MDPATASSSSHSPREGSTSTSLEQTSNPPLASSSSPSHHNTRSMSPVLEPFGPWGKPTTTLREVCGVGSLICAMLVTQSQLAQVILPLSEIATTFGVQDSAGRQSWFAAAYSLSVGTVILPAGRLGDMYGNKLMVLIGFSWACLGSLLCGLSSYSHSDICFDVFRAFQGLGFSIALPNAAAILARSSVDGQWRRVIYFTIFAASAPNGFLIGAIFASLIAQFHPEHWDFSFYLATVCLFGLTILAWATVPSDEYLTRFYKEAEEERSGEVAPPQAKPGFDWLGTLFALTGLILVNFAWNQAGVVGWSEPYNGVLLGVGLICIAIFLYVESKVAYPLIPVDIWTPQNSVVVGCIALGWSSFGIWNFYSVRWWIDIRGASLLQATAYAAPAGVSGCFAATLSAILLKHAGPSWTMLSALSAFFLAGILIATMPEQQNYWINSFLSWCAGPFGMDQSFPAASLIIASALPPHKQGVAGSLVNTVINWSVAIGLGVAGTVEANTNAGGTDILTAYRSAAYLGSGLAGLGVILAASNVAVVLIRGSRKSSSSTDHAGQEKGTDSTTDVDEAEAGTRMGAGTPGAEIGGGMGDEMSVPKPERGTEGQSDQAEQQPLENEHNVYI